MTHLYKKLQLYFLLLLGCFSAHSQTNSKQSCKIEIYLLKTVIPDTTVQGLKGPFAVKLSDLQDTAFIKDPEILSYTIGVGKAGFRIKPGAGQRLNKEGISLSSGRQFAVVANGQVVYTGYFWNWISSWGCGWVNAYLANEYILISKGMPGDVFKPGHDHILENKQLLDCLRSTNRLTDK